MLKSKQLAQKNETCHLCYASTHTHTKTTCTKRMKLVMSGMLPHTQKQTHTHTHHKPQETEKKAEMLCHLRHCM